MYYLYLYNPHLLDVYVYIKYNLEIIRTYQDYFRPSTPIEPPIILDDFDSSTSNSIVNSIPNKEAENSIPSPSRSRVP